jgi:hypothetical protein
MKSDQLDQLAWEHARTDTIRRLLHRRDAFFDSAEQWGAFVGLVLDEWQAGCPGVGSITEAFIEIERLGTRVQVSPSPPVEPTLCWHIDWIWSVLVDTRRRLALEEADDNDRSEPDGDDVAVAELAMNVWSQIDVFGQTQRKTALRTELSIGGVHTCLHDTRRAIFASLRTRGRLRL